MIEVAQKDPPTLMSAEELFDALAVLIGRTLMVSYPGRKGSYSYSPVSPSRIVGELRWLKLDEEYSSIVLDMGKPIFGEYAKLSSIGLNCKVSVLSDGAWKIIHQPEAKQQLSA